MSDQDQKTVDCWLCNGAGITWNGGITLKDPKPQTCSFCDGAGQLTPDETASRLKGLIDVVASLPGSESNEVKLSRFQVEAGQTGGMEAERRFLAERGIQAKPGIEKERLLPHQGGEISERQRELAAILQAEEEYEARLAEALANAEPTPDPVKRPRLTALEVERRFLAERGIKASPGIPSSQLLPHEGGEFSEEERDLQAILKAHEEWKKQRAATLARIEEEARHDKELQERYGPDLYQAYKSGRFSQLEADGLASRYSVTLTGKVE
jgi:hypothetical protein